MLLRFYILFIVSLYCYAGTAQTPVLFKSLALKARFLTVDELGNAYVVRNDNTLLRYNENGDSTGFYKSVLNGDIGMIDATNPLRVLVYYPSYAKVVVLDRMLAPKNELDLRKINLSNAVAIASSADGNMWVYDRFNARLKKVDDQLKEIVQSNDLRQEIQNVPHPTFMTERNWKTYLCDSVKGIYVFDRYGSYVNTLPMLHVGQLQVTGATLIYRVGDTLYSWEQEKVRGKQIAIPWRHTKVMSALLVRENLYVLYEDELVIYDFRED